MQISVQIQGSHGPFKSMKFYVTADNTPIFPSVYRNVKCVGHQKNFGGRSLKGFNFFWIRVGTRR